MDIPYVLSRLRPGATWNLVGDTFDGLTWTNGDKPPTFAECEAAWEKMKHEYALRPMRVERNRLLAATDWTQAADAPVDIEAWAAYRQALRDLPTTIKDPAQPIDWPTPPK